jgi:hypothetical protein
VHYTLHVSHLFLNFLQVVEAVTFQRVVLYEACIERWPSHRARLFYAICLLLLQSVIPALVVATVRTRIFFCYVKIRVNGVRKRRVKFVFRHEYLRLRCEYGKLQETVVTFRRWQGL